MVVHHEHLNLGIAVDVERPDGSRSLLVPNIKAADTLDFAAVLRRVRRAHRARSATNKLSPDDFAGTTVLDHQPRDDRHGALGPAAHARPGLHHRRRLDRATRAEYEGADPATLARLGVSKVLTLTSTYDHRIIAGRRVRRVPRGGSTSSCSARTASTTRSSRASASRTSRRAGAPTASPLDDARTTAAEKVVRVHQLINMYRVRGHLIANLDPLGRPRRARTPSSTSRHYGLSIWDLDREFPAAALGRALAHDPAAARHPGHPARRVRADHRRRVHAHPGARAEGLDPGAGRGRRRPPSSTTSSAASSSA